MFLPFGFSVILFNLHYTQITLPTQITPPYPMHETHFGRFRSPCELDLRSNFQIDFSSSADTSRLDERNTMVFLVYFSLKCEKHFIEKRSFFKEHWTISYQICLKSKHTVVGAIYGFSGAVFGFPLAVIIFDILPISQQCDSYFGKKN